LVAAAFGVSGFMDLESQTGPAGLEATKADNLIKERLRQQTAPQEFILVESAAATADDSAFASFVDSLVADLEAIREVSSVASYRDGSQGLVSSDGRTALVVVTLAGDEVDAAETAKPVVDAVSEVDGRGGFRVTTVGFGSVSLEINSLLEKTLEQGELIGIVIALLVLVVVFGSVVAAGVPIVIAMLSIFVAVGATALASNVMEMSDYVVFIITMIGLAVGIDYSLFIVQRYREERAGGLEIRQALNCQSRRTLFWNGGDGRLGGHAHNPGPGVPGLRSRRHAGRRGDPSGGSNPPPGRAVAAGRPRQLANAALHRQERFGAGHRWSVGGRHARRDRTAGRHPSPFGQPPRFGSVASAGHRPGKRRH